MAERLPGTEPPWHVRGAEEAVEAWEVDPATGLTAVEVRARLERYGRNTIRTGKLKPWPLILLHQFADPLIYILILAGIASALLREWVDAGVIALVVSLNAVVGFYQELQARKAIQALAAMSAPRARVLREGAPTEIETAEVVPGDVVLLEAGDRVPADLRMIEVSRMEVDESALTGESEPVPKQVEPVADARAVPGDQRSLAFLGTHITRGRGRGVVVRTGDASELGRIAEVTRGMDEVQTPIQVKMGRLGRAIGIAVFVLSVLVVGGGLRMGIGLREVVSLAVALAVGGVPEALPVVLTVTLALGARRMAARNAIIRSLPAVETLGSTTVIGSDKTGTLTRNEMTVRVLWSGGERFEIPPEGEIRSSSGAGLSPAARQTLRAGLLANEADALPSDDGAGGDPTEVAVLVAAARGGLGLESREDFPRLELIPFASEQQFVASRNQTSGGPTLYLKGAPEVVLERCARQLAPDGSEQPLDRSRLREVAAQLAGEGYRVLGMALRHQVERIEGNDPGDHLVFAGFQAMEDPVRPEAVEAVKAAQEAGIRVIMLTGDHARTARAIGEQVGLRTARVEEGRALSERSDEELDRIVREVDIYARVSPEHKLRLVERLQAQGEIVAITGDGVNDAPALQAAHLGIAMGKEGTDVAREASDMVLADDNFASITNAVEEGRVVFQNIRKVTYFVLCTAVALVATVLSSLVGPWPLPFLAVQVLWINLVTTGLQDVALAFEPGEPGLLKEPPRDPSEQVVNRPLALRMVGMGLLMTVGTLGIFLWALQQGAPPPLARSVAMTQMVLFQFFHVFNCRSLHRSILQVPFFSNPFVLITMGLAVIAHLIILYVPFFQTLFNTVSIPGELWLPMVGVALSIVAVAELDKLILRGRRERRGARQWLAEAPVG